MSRCRCVVILLKVLMIFAITFSWRGIFTDIGGSTQCSHWRCISKQKIILFLPFNSLWKDFVFLLPRKILEIVLLGLVQLDFSVNFILSFGWVLTDHDWLLVTVMVLLQYLSFHFLKLFKFQLLEDLLLPVVELWFQCLFWFTHRQRVLVLYQVEIERLLLVFLIFALLLWDSGIFVFLFLKIKLFQFRFCGGFFFSFNFLLLKLFFFCHHLVDEIKSFLLELLVLVWYLIVF